MVVPRSSVEIDHDDEFTLFAVVTFKKHSAEFVHKCREQKWTPRQYKYVEGGREEEQRELDRVTNEERKVCGEALRMGRTGWSESVMIWVHVLTLRVFVEAVLRYGLPLDYATALIKVCYIMLFTFYTWPVDNLDWFFGLMPHHYLSMSTDYLWNRRHRSWPPRQRQRWTQSIHTWVEMRSEGTSTAGSRKMMPPLAQRWPRRD